MLVGLLQWKGAPRPMEGGDLAWCGPRLRDYEMPPADLPLIPAIQDLLMRRRVM